jgi:hypothetical protein
VAGGVGYIDADRDGVADGDSILDYRWKEGTNAFCERFDQLIGTQDIIIFANGGVPARSYQWTNGRFHEGFPGPIGGTPPDWYASVIGPQYGYLPEESWYSSDPQQMITLQGLNFWPTDCDPSRLSTTETPYNLPCVQPVIDLTLASALLGDGYSCVTGWARNSEGEVLNYHTTWWLSLYDSLRVNLGEPLGTYYDSTGNYAWQDAYIRQYEGGMAKVLYPSSNLTASGYLELRPKAAFRQPVASTWPVGSVQTIRFRGWDPLNTGMSSVRVLLSRNGGASFPETLGVYGPNDSLATITVSGPAAANCRVRIEARDSAGWIGGVTSGNVAITGTATPINAIAEAVPRVFTAGSAVSLNLYTRLDQAGSGGVGEIRLVRPASFASWSATGAFLNGNPLVGTISTAGDTIRVVSSAPLVAGSVVRVALSATASQLINPGTAVKDFVVPWGGGTPVAAPAGNADGVSGNSESLTIVVDAGPLARIIVSPPNATLNVTETRQFAASGRDAYDNIVVVTPGWSVTGGIGSITSGGLFTATATGSGLVIAASGAIRDSAEVTVASNAPATLVISPDSAIVAADGTRDFDVAAYDAEGNPVPVTGTWSVIGGIGTISPSGIFTPSTVGIGYVRCTAAGLVDSAGVTVVVGAPSAITVTPSTATIPADSSRLFSATVTDSRGNVRNDPVTWRVRGTIGIVNQAGRFTPTSLGSGWVVATSGALADSSDIVVVPGPPAVVSISPDSAAVQLGEEAQFVALVYDSRGNAVPPQLTWSAAGACSLVSPGIVRGRAIGEGRVYAIQGAARDTAHVTVAGPPPGSPDKFVTITAPPDYVRVSPSGNLDTLHVEARVSIGGMPDTSVSESEIRLLVTGGGGACAPDTLAAQPIAGEPGAFAFETAALGGCGMIDFDLIVDDIPTPTSGTAELRSPDVDGDGAIGLFDAAAFLPGYHSGAGGCADLDADGALGVDDLDWFVAEFQNACAAGVMVGGGGAASPRTTSQPTAILRISGTRAPDTLGLARPGYDIIDATLSLEGAAGLAALDLSMDGEGEVIDLSDPPPSASGLVAYPLALDAGECLSVLWVASEAPDSSAATVMGELKLAIPSGAAPEDFVIDVSLVDASYGVLEWADVEWEIPVDSTLGVDDDDPPIDPPVDPPAESPAAVYKLYPPSPNPARDDVRIRFAVPANADGPVRVSLYDTAGRLIAVIADGRLSPGDHESIWIGDDGSERVSAGVYFVRLVAPQYSETQRVIRIR